MHTVCTLRDDIAEMNCEEYGLVDSQSIYAALFILAEQNNKLAFMRRSLEDAVDKVSEEDVGEEESVKSDAVSFGEIYSVSLLYNFVKDIFPYYVSASEREKPEKILKYMNYVLSALDDLAEGKPLKEFSFSFVLRVQDEMKYLSVSGQMSKSIFIHLPFKVHQLVDFESRLCGDFVVDYARGGGVP